VIATTAFGTHSNSIDNSNAEFYNKGLQLTEFNGIRKLVLMGWVVAPKLMEALKIPFLPNDLKQFFTTIITENIKYREQNNKSRPDMIQLLLDERKSQKQKLKEMGHPESDENGKYFLIANF